MTFLEVAVFSALPQSAPHPGTRQSADAYWMHAVGWAHSEAVGQDSGLLLRGVSLPERRRNSLGPTLRVLGTEGAPGSALRMGPESLEAAQSSNTWA